MPAENTIPTPQALSAVQFGRPDAGWRLRGLADAGGGIRSWLDRLTQFIGLVGLSSLLVGGVGVGNALGRPVGVAVDRVGALLVADDVGNVIWRVAPK